MSLGLRLLSWQYIYEGLVRPSLPQGEARLLQLLGEWFEWLSFLGAVSSSCTGEIRGRALKYEVELSRSETWQEEFTLVNGK